MNSDKPNPFLSPEWLDAQRRLLEAWQHIASMSKTANTGPVNQSPFAGTADYWWKLVSGSLTNDSIDMVNKMQEQGKLFYFITDQMTNLLNTFNQVNKAGSDWQSALNAQFDQIKQVFTQTQNENNQAMHQMMGIWQLLPIDTLQRTMSSTSFMPGDIFQGIKPEEMQLVTDKFLSMPGVGYTRESQEKIQLGIKLWNDYQKVAQEYNSEMYKVVIAALDDMKQRILKMSQEGKDINSVRQIYDIWVDCNEDAYARFTFSPEFSDLYGRLTNALMAVKQHGQIIVDEILGAMSMPTRRGMNTLQKRQQEMRREYKKTVKKVEMLEKKLKSHAETPVVAAEHKETGKIVTKQKSTKKAGAKKDKHSGKKKTESKSASSKKSARSAGRRQKEEMIVIKI